LKLKNNGEDYRFQNPVWVRNWALSR